MKLKSITEDGMYLVSDAGEVFRKIGEADYAQRKTQIVHGYEIANIRGKNYRVHRLVLAAFVGPCPEGKECSHKDGNKLNNHVSNLEWATRLENARMRQVHGTQYCKLSKAKVEYIRKNFDKFGAKQLAKRLGVSKSTINLAVNGTTWGHVGEITRLRQIPTKDRLLCVRGHKLPVELKRNGTKRKRCPECQRLYRAKAASGEGDV